MAKTTSQSVREKLPPPNLLEERSLANKKIQLQIEKGEQIRDKEIKTIEEVKIVRAERDIWSKYNIELLSRLFDNSMMADEYNYSAFGISYLGGQSFQETVNDFREEVNRKITRLRAIQERLELIPELQPHKIPASAAPRGVPAG